MAPPPCKLKPSFHTRPVKQAFYNVTHKMVSFLFQPWVLNTWLASRAFSRQVSRLSVRQLKVPVKKGHIWVVFTFWRFVAYMAINYCVSRIYGSPVTCRLRCGASSRFCLGKSLLLIPEFRTTLGALPLNMCQPEREQVLHIPSAIKYKELYKKISCLDSLPSR